MLAKLKSALSAVSRWAWLAISALALLWAVGRVRRAEKAAEAAAERYERTFDADQAEDAETVRDALRQHSEAQARIRKEKRRAEVKRDQLASGDDRLSDLLHDYNRDRLRDEHEPTP